MRTWYSLHTYRTTSQQRFVRSGGAPSLTPTSTTNTLIWLCPSPCSKPHPPPFNQSCIIHTPSTFSREGEFHQCVTHGRWQWFVNTPIWCFLACCRQLSALVSLSLLLASSSKVKSHCLDEFTVSMNCVDEFIFYLNPHITKNSIRCWGLYSYGMSMDRPYLS